MIKSFTDWLKVREGLGGGPYIGNCVDTSDYQVLGACSDQNSEKKNKAYRHGGVDHKKVHKHSDKIRQGKAHLEGVYTA
jgi:hypothetical protein